jgi:hypothetical protein
VIKRGDYKVFLTPEGDPRLYVRRKSAASFEVRELTHPTGGAMTPSKTRPPLRFFQRSILIVEPTDHLPQAHFLPIV